MNKRKIGSDIEQKAVNYLSSNGYNIKARNYFTKYGEIDIVAENENYLCFIEVKYRRNKSDGYPEEAVDYRKIQKISRAAQVYLTAHGYDEYYPCRFDIVSVLDSEYKILKNAFDADISFT